MTKELEEKLVSAYPELFIDYGGDKKETLMTYGCEFHDGWYKIIENLCEILTDLTKQPPCVKLKEKFQVENIKFGSVSNFSSIKFAQLKEKFGSMRCYLDASFALYEDKFDEGDYATREQYWRGQINGAVRFAELLSTQTCEITGKPGKLRTDLWWIRTLCDEEYEKVKE